MTRGSRFALFVLILCLSAFSLGPTSAQAVTLLVNGSGILTGATGVDVGGTLYDVEFLDGTCVALFTGCDANSDFTFQTQTAAQVASQALLTHVLLDTSLGNFDSSPYLTNGCQSTSLNCGILTPFNVRPHPTIPAITQHLTFFTQNGPPSPDVVAGPVDTSETADLSGITFATWAVWSPATAVPEPATLTLLGFALAALVLWDYRQRQRRRTGTPHP